MQTNDAISFVNKHVCARCWSRLKAVSVNGELEPVCTNENCDHPGHFVTKNYADRRRSESIGELSEVKRNLRAMAPQNRLSEAELISSLGF